MTTNTSKLSTWLFWAPLRFATTAFVATILTGILYIIITGALFQSNHIPQRPIALISLIMILACIYLLERKLPQNKMDQTSFVLVHNAQTILASVLFIISSYTIIHNINRILFYLMTLETRSTLLFILTIMLGTIFLMYISGILITNFFAKFRRIQNFNIPTWKIIFSLPFGFSALWVPGYMLNNTTNNKTGISTKINWYKRLNDIIVSSPANLITSFIPTTILSGFLFGLNGILITFTLSTIFGIWVSKVGQKEFIKNIAGKYTTTSIIINIVLLACTLLMLKHMPTSQQDIQINISETQQTINQ